MLRFSSWLINMCYFCFNKTENCNNNQSNFLFLFRKKPTDTNVLFSYTTLVLICCLLGFFFMTHSFETILFLTKIEYCCWTDLSMILVSILLMTGVINIKEHVFLTQMHWNFTGEKYLHVNREYDIYMYFLWNRVGLLACVMLIWYKYYLLDIRLFILNQGKYHLSC